MDTRGKVERLINPICAAFETSCVTTLDHQNDGTSVGLILFERGNQLFHATVFVEPQCCIVLALRSNMSNRTQRFVSDEQVAGLLESDMDTINALSHDLKEDIVLIMQREKSN